MKKRPSIILAAVIAAGIAVGLVYFWSRDLPSGQPPALLPSQSMDTVSIEQAVQAANAWLDLPGVAGVGQGKTKGRDCIVVLLTGDTASLAGKIPNAFMGHPVTFQPLGGPIEAQ
jgi:hypothetical protein